MVVLTRRALLGWVRSPPARRGGGEGRTLINGAAGGWVHALCSVQGRLSRRTVTGEGVTLAMHHQPCRRASCLVCQASCTGERHAHSPLTLKLLPKKAGPVTHTPPAPMRPARDACTHSTGTQAPHPARTAPRLPGQSAAALHTHMQAACHTQRGGRK